MDRTSLDLEARARAVERSVSSKQDGKAALNAAIEALELYMHALKLTKDPAQQKKLDGKCKELLAHAESLKSATNGNYPAVSSTTSLKYPISTRKLTTRENIILLEGSKLNGFVFKPWSKTPDEDEFLLKDGESAFSDSSLLPLSPAQIESFGGWKRPADALPTIKIERDGKILPNRPFMVLPGKIDLVQDMTSDCSVVASLCAGTSRAERGHSRLMGCIMYPNDPQTGCATQSPNGKYILRLYFNGCWRRVEIDDFLPTSKTSRILHVVDRSHPGLLWPALMEKAYLKVRGGYDFPGSNSGTDLAVLTGWIPQQIFLHDEDMQVDQLWEELSTAFNRGDNLLTIGTGKLSRREQKQLGLAAEHDYAVLEMNEDHGTRELLIKNPWADGDVWKGAVRRRPNPNHEFDDPKPDDSSDEMLPGTFWMDFNSIFQYFENLYVNWNPALFLQRQDLHLTWEISTARPSANIFIDNPQFAIRSTEAGEVWLLLNRHFRTGDYTHANNGKNGYISLSIYDGNGYRILSSEHAKHRGPFVDSPNTLLRFHTTAAMSYTAVIAAQDLPLGKHNFSLSALSNTDGRLVEAQSRFSSLHSLSAAWTRANAGGNSDSPNYLLNPQFRVEVKVDQDVAFVLRIADSNADPADKTEIHVKMLVASSDGKRITRLRSRDVISHSGDYRRGSAVIETLLTKGLYSIICSTFDENQFSKFNIDFHSSLKDTTKLISLPSESSGRLVITTELALFEPGIDRLLAPVTVNRVTKAILMAKYKDRMPTSSLFKLSLEQGQGPYKQTLVDSSFDNEDFHTISTGLRIDDTDLHPVLHTAGAGGLWLVLERMPSTSKSSDQTECLFVDLLVEEAVTIGQWGLGTG